MRTHDLTRLLTFNGGDFTRFPGLTILDPNTPTPPGAGRNAPPKKGAGGVDAKGQVAVVDSSFSTAAVGGSGWDQGWGWTNAAGYQDATAGAGGTSLQLPHLVQLNGDTSLAVVYGPGAAEYLDSYGGAYHGRRNAQTGTVKASNQFTYTDGRGNAWLFYDFSGSTPTGRAGKMISSTTADGTTTTVTSWDGSGRPTEVQRVTGSGGSAVTESMTTSYVATGANAGLVDAVTWRRKVGAGSWTTARTAEYAYYVSTDTNGRATQLKTSVVKDGAGAVLDTTYYRYYVPGSGVGLLKYQFGTAAYAKLTGALGTGVDALTDGQVDGYADHYFAYDGSGRVTTHTAAGAGCSLCTGGQGTYTYAYSSNSVSGVPVQGGSNVWRDKVVETLPDGNQNTYYYNGSGDLMLRVYEDTTTNDEWCWYYRYDAAGRVVLAAEPSAVTGYDEQYADLVNDQGGDFQYVSNAAGLVATTAYATSTTATTSTAGTAADFQTGTGIRQGELGTDVPQSAAAYIKRIAGGRDYFFPASSTQYRNDNGTGGQTTTVAYTWQGSTAEAASVTVTLPTVTTAQNGPNSATSMTTFNDAFGRPIWSKDAAGFLSYTEYDAQTGAVVKTIADVNTANTGDFANLPSGWTTPSGGGLHLISQYEVDALGRVTKATSPNGRVDYTVYKDSAHEVRYYPAWNSSTNLPTGPIAVSRDDRRAGTQRH